MSICTWDPNNKSTNTTLSDGDLTAYLPNQSALVLGTIGHSKGKYYFELIQTVGIRLFMGIANENLTRSNIDLNGRYFFAYNGKKYPGANNYAESFGVGDCAGIAVDIDNGTLELFKNGVSQGIAFSDIKDLGTTIYPFVSNGTDVYGAATVTANFGATPFQYPVEGFLAWNNDGEEAENPLELHIVLEVDEQIQLIGNVLPEMAGDPNLEWSSNLSSVASVDSTGMVTAHAEGYTHIKVKTINGEWNDFARVKVVAKGEGDKYRLSILLKTGESCLLESVFNLEDSAEGVVWTSGTPEVAAVDPSNTVQTRVTALSKGLTLVTVQTIDGSKQDQIYVTVIE
ncbi:Ig-like domain-containing protein|uniref:SPRY domain-containing protein n=1 Tax=Dendrosporobacter quercicolus TaxID=146817 RepID=A0A1G9YSX8_9FIRM|nr:Ig-like domain-containing protein [Dendrosporobacter quercicolus]NSL49859.1 Ig-like domain-containing protein [Dendrosporobacter quercicolus DSM 1736]SDN11601.1 SPRY domain-containing protein [Dendrosporobacter quercicolus]